MQIVSVFWHGMDVELSGTFRAARPAPNVQDHDAPGFADPGDPAEVEIAAAWFVDGKSRVPISSELIETIKESEVIEDQVF